MEGQTKKGEPPFFFSRSILCSSFRAGGAGGKYTWGVPGVADLDAVKVVDEKDPDYDSEAEEVCSFSYSRHAHLV